jgi:hypothetical protein
MRMNDLLKAFQELRDSLFSKKPLRKWFKLTIPKGKRKKLAHKKWLKKTGQWAYLRTAEKLIEATFEEHNLHDRINKHFTDLATLGHSEFDIEKYLKGEHLG